MEIIISNLPSCEPFENVFFIVYCNVTSMCVFFSYTTSPQGILVLYKNLQPDEENQRQGRSE